MTGLAGPAAMWWRSLRVSREDLGRDVVAGIPGAVGSVPDGMAASVLAGVSPVHGLFASFAGPIAGGLLGSTQLMVITTTSAAALAAGSGIEALRPDERASALFLLTVLAGIAMVVAGALRLGRYTRFVSHSVMMGFLTGVAANIVLGQLADLTGAQAHGDTALARAVDLLRHPDRIDGASLLVGALAIATMLVVSRVRGRIGQMAALAALAVPSIVAVIADLEVTRVDAAGDLPRGLPVPALPSLEHLSLNLVTAALAVAAIVLVQGAGVSESVANPDGEPSSPSRDFLAQGAGNIASGVFLGQPVGGSVGQTALNVTAGARTRWASVAAGLWMMAILVAFSGIVGAVAIPTLAAVLVVAAVSSVRGPELLTVWRTSWSARIAIATTFVCTLLMPIQIAVGIGVALSALLQLNRDAMDLAVVELVRETNGRVREHSAPRSLQTGTVTVVDVYGNTFFAGARTLEERLPTATGVRDAALVVRLRGRTGLGATFQQVLERYSQHLAAGGNRIYLSGLAPDVLDQLERLGVLGRCSNLRVMPATPYVGESTELAVVAAREWVAQASAGDDSHPGR